MARLRAFIKNNGAALSAFLIYSVAAMFIIDKFPFMHSDEAWLSGLSHTVLAEGRFDLTEPFFDLYPRNPHAIKLLFVSLQSSVIGIFGHSLISMRMISLVCGLASLCIFYRIAVQRFENKSFALLSTMLLAVDIQFIYASHMARQEIILLLISLAAYAYFSGRKSLTPANAAFLAAILALGIGVHPNSFIVSIPFGLFLVYSFARNRKEWLNVAAFTGVLAAAASFFVFLSLRMDPGFVGNYAAYGETLGVTESLLSKLFQIRLFYLKLYHMVSGTYYTPDIRPQLLLMAPLFLWGIARLVKSKGASHAAYPLLGLIGVNIGYLLVGRYNQTSIVFLFPWLYLLAAELLRPIGKSRNWILAFLIAASLSSSLLQIYAHPGKDYSSYLEKISENVPEDARVLANLNTTYYFNPGNLFDYRNLAHLKKNNLDFAAYIEKNDIEFILYPEEMDIIWNTRPVYNSLYGNPSDYYESMKAFLDEKCRLLGEISDDTYPVRIVSLMGKEERTLRIYRVLD